MSLLISYTPEGHIGKPLSTEIPISESYQEVIDSACEAWRYSLPPQQWIVSCRLAREVQREDGTSQWVILQPQRFVEFMQTHRERTERLELRLQVEVLYQPDECVDSSPYDMPSRASSSIHVGYLGRLRALNVSNANTTTEPWPLRISSSSQSEFG
ncbi:hypothetical protein FRC12_024354, partial [Ceratobasidium sp. 428]